MEKSRDEIYEKERNSMPVSARGSPELPKKQTRESTKNSEKLNGEREATEAFPLPATVCSSVR